MISNQLLQRAIDDINKISGRSLSVMDLDGRTVAAVGESFEADEENVAAFVVSQNEEETKGNYFLLKIKEDGHDAYVLLVCGNSEGDILTGRMTKYELETLIKAYREKYDRESFFKSLLLENLMLVDIFDRSKRLHIDIEGERVVFIVRTQNKNQDDVIDFVRAAITGGRDNISFAFDQHTVVGIRSIENGETPETIFKFAERLVSGIRHETGEEPRVAYGSVINDLKDIPRSYREARMALEVGKIFFTEKAVNSYASLGIGRLIYQLPLPLCRMYLAEIFGDFSPENLEEELILTFEQFFENSLNVSETARKLFIHRNTLLYRLEKIEKLTGLDLRRFEDAIIFKIAMMVSKYMQHVDGLKSGIQ